MLAAMTLLAVVFSADLGATSPKELLASGEQLEEQGELDSAMVMYSLAIDADSSSFEPYLMKGQVLCKLARPEDAVTCFNAVLAMDSTYADAYFYRGCSWLVGSGTRASSPSNAAADFSSALKYGFDNPRIYYHLAYARERLGDTLAAIEDYKTYLLKTYDTETRTAERARGRISELEAGLRESK